MSKAIPTTMLAWRKQYPKKEPFRLEVPVPGVGFDDLLIKIHAAGICHSDRTILDLESPPPGYRDHFTLGHEGCGEVVKVGANISSFTPGDMVCILCNPGCLAPTCDVCQLGLTQLCVNGEQYGLSHDGCYASYIRVKEHAVVPLPDGISPLVGAVTTDAVLTAYHAVYGRAAVKSFQTILLFGIGGLGFNALQMILHIGARVIVVDQRQEVLDEAVRFGTPEEDIVPVGESVVDFLKERKLVIDTTMDFVGKEATFKIAQEAVRQAGTIVMIGVMDSRITVDNMAAIRGQITILFSYGGNRTDLAACLDMVAKGIIKPQVVTGKLEQFPQILRDLDEGRIKSRIALVPEGH